MHPGCIINQVKKADVLEKVMLDQAVHSAVITERMAQHSRVKVNKQQSQAQRRYGAIIRYHNTLKKELSVDP